MTYITTLYSKSAKLVERVMLSETKHPSGVKNGDSSLRSDLC